ncbi:hypothetical protein AOXY_G3543 [Acipenser oxyrinchus oxyrinchus]|uniref:Uncharacterized protein n=1 Tax=Acipenser oxyrinchus oxyrinchus TaxID=40147 RepID=A0AAD8GFF1_ACIOX|nr:hypothetical protein AOXY_G3543 [Acipenser oxyrinchus oxyrinchus]
MQLEQKSSCRTHYRSCCCAVGCDLVQTNCRRATQCDDRFRGRATSRGWAASQGSRAATNPRPPCQSWTAIPPGSGLLGTATPLHTVGQMLASTAPTATSEPGCCLARAACCSHGAGHSLPGGRTLSQTAVVEWSSLAAAAARGSFSQAIALGTLAMLGSLSRAQALAA